jgi:MSHA pilin protein MshD
MPTERTHRGFSLVEALVAIVIVSVALAGVVSVFQQAMRGSNNPVVTNQLVALAEEMMEEVQLKPYATARSGTYTGCARTDFTVVYDYKGYATSAGLCDIDGNLISALSAYAVQVDVATTTLSGVSEALIITVTVSRGSDSFVLHGWRTRYGVEP